jgi:predicted transcriptional regulator
VRDIYNRQLRGLATRKDVAEAIRILEEHGWVRLVKVKPTGGGRPSEVVHVHPDLRV